MARSTIPLPPLQNALLTSLSVDLLDQLAPGLTTLGLQQGTVLCESGEDIDDVYFPHDGMLSLLAVMKDGNVVEVATVGREGVVGAMAGFGVGKSQVRGVVQLSMTASKMPVARFQLLLRASDELQAMTIRYNEMLLGQARVTAACNVLHSVRARLCRWLLQASDRAGSDTIALTQQSLAEMLGVRRTSVTEVAQAIQETGAIIYSRGVIVILDRQRLLQSSCECYQTPWD